MCAHLAMVERSLGSYSAVVDQNELYYYYYVGAARAQVCGREREMNEINTFVC